MDWLGAPAFIGSTNCSRAAQAHAENATIFRTKKSLQLEQAFASGSWDRGNELFIDNQIARAFQPGALAAQKEASTGPDPNETIPQAWQTAAKGEVAMDWLGAPAFVGKFSTFKSAQHHAEEATKFRTKRNTNLEQAFTNGTWDRTSELFIDNQIARALQPRTRKSRKTALTQLYSFLKATDRQHYWAPPLMDAKTLLLQRSEEEILATFALT
jgi:hypothetical protein